MKIDRNAQHLFSPFRLKVAAIITELNVWCKIHKPEYQAVLAEGYRSVARQQELYAQGRTKPGDIVTYKDGVDEESNHQTCLAADIVPMASDGSIDWEAAAFFAYLQHLAHVQGLVSGADWVKFKDLDHIEWRTADKGIYQHARDWKAQQKLP